MSSDQPNEEGRAGAAFEETMVGLEKARDTVEDDFRSRLAELDRHVERLAAATSELGSRAHAVQEQRDVIAERSRARLASARAAEADPEREAGSWPTGKSPLRRLINSIMSRLLRDYLETIDRRGAELRDRLEILEGLVEDMLVLSGDGTEVEDEAAQPRPAGGADLQAAVREALSCASEALAAATAVHRRTLELINAKDAEMLQRAVGGPLARMELVFDEFARQQEALLAQLVGRRHELDELIEKVSGPSGEPR